MAGIPGSNLGVTRQTVAVSSTFSRLVGLVILLFDLTRRSAGAYTETVRLSRLLVTLLLALAVIVSIAEPLAADACDGDKTAMAMSAADLDSGAGGSRAPDGHPMHLCHCVHLHGGVPAVSVRRAPFVSRMTVETGAQSVPSSIDRAPPVRPPLSTNG